MDTLFIDDPSSAPQGWDETFDEALLPLLLRESRRFVVPTSPFSVPPVGLFTPLSEVNDPTQPDPTDPNSLLYLPQPDLFCADSNDPVNPMRPQSSEGWTEFVWNKEKHYWVSDKVGARIRVDIKANEGRWVTLVTACDGVGADGPSESRCTTSGANTTISGMRSAGSTTTRRAQKPSAATGTSRSTCLCE